MREESNYFFCYNRVAMGELKRKGLSYICVALHEKTGNRFWLFERTLALNEALKELSK